ncbi:hypothetical protein MCOR02_011316 [Pyricularia oryzae]|uniref:Clr5 domain-containing protein n=1 Tax=Pyricularia oryzae TaxID=318829 RepID=A0A4P7NBB8_PYROR|nr:hypothetical protein MCOR02_011316 [Pyricularia oryzae]KAI6305890.1 hypothetical protein MCOR34_008320 [Pyricularia oryzae]KAI6464504.1 hypothetical protein MCOR17_005330 [Pyricularia oryzae]KAI6494437.1 hypothetical protein MCOR13_007497 [Pyricularia oryzae]KAI6588257.1 hypothetical protein MCOR04_004161 [Pyricularia oryzae]
MSQMASPLSCRFQVSDCHLSDKSLKSSYFAPELILHSPTDEMGSSSQEGGLPDPGAGSSSDQDLRKSNESANQRSKKRELRRQNWEQHRATIKRLYIDEGRKLNDIVEIMKREHDFVANSRMYKHRLSQWGLIKYNRESDVQRVLLEKKRREAEGKDSHIEINGRPVDFERIQKYLQRRKVSVDDFIEDNFEEGSGIMENPGTPSREDGLSITIRTPSPLPYYRESLFPTPPMSLGLSLSPVQQPPSSSPVFQVAEEVIWDTRACASEIPDRDDYAKATQPTPLGIAFTDSVMMIHLFMTENDPNQAGEYMQHACDQIKDLLQQAPLEALLCLFEAVLFLADVAPEVVALILRHAADMSAVLVTPETHPMRHVLTKLAEISRGKDPDSMLALRQTAARAFQCHLATWDRILGPSSPVMLYWYIRYLRVLSPEDVAEGYFYGTERLVNDMLSLEQYKAGPRTSALPEIALGNMAAGIPLERCSLLVRWEMAHARSAPKIYRLLQTLLANLDRHASSSGSGSSVSQAFIHFTLAGSARDLKRPSDAESHGSRAMDILRSVGMHDTADSVQNWMAKWEDSAPIGTDVYRAQLGIAAFAQST